MPLCVCVLVVNRIELGHYEYWLWVGSRSWQSYQKNMAAINAIGKYAWAVGISGSLIFCFPSSVGWFILKLFQYPRLYDGEGRVIC